MLIRHLVDDFGEDFTITMAPISTSLESDGGSMAGFNYKTLYESRRREYFMVSYAMLLFFFKEHTTQDYSKWISL